MKPRRLTAAAVLVAALAATSAASADVAEDRAAARQHLTQAQDFKKQGNLAEALGHFQESQRLDPKLATLLELADCAEQLGKLVEAQGYWAAGRDQAKKDEKPQSRARAEQRLAAVEKRVAHYTLQLAAGSPADTQVFHDAVLVDAAALGTAVAANPGEHSVVVKASGHEDAKFELKLAEGDNQTLPIAVGPAIVVAPPPPPPPPPKPVVQAPPPDSSSSGSGQRTVGLIVGAGGIVGLGVGGLLWNVGYRNSNSLGSTAGNQMLAGQVLVVTGGALLVTGVVLFATAPSGNTARAKHLPIVPVVAVGSNATVLGAAGEF
ncbi:MAG TPA: hypothetical protein VHP33_05095 [Polyangiaceae bacterium]|nr:hypothetical protein [Polyangiaceae bacterium]